MNLSLKAPIIFTLAILFSTLIFPVFAQNGGSAAYPFSQSPYLVGERLSYNVSFSAFPSVAHAEFEVVSRGVFFGRDAVQVRAHVETGDIINVALLSLDNEYTSYVDPATGLPFRSEETVRDAIKSNNSTQDLNQPAGTDAIPPKQIGAAGIYDLLSAFYRARALPLASGAEYDLNVHGDTGDYQVQLKVIGTDSINTNVGSFSTIVTQVRISNSPLRNVRAYFSDDERHVPVLISARVASGELRAELAASEIVTPPATAAPTPAIAVNPAPLPAPTPNPTVPVVNESWPFAVGEQLNYQIFIGSEAVPMGIATFQVRGRSRYFDHDGFYLTVNAQTTNALARVFVARDQIDSYVDPKALFPFRTVMNLSEGKRRLNQLLTFDQETGTAVLNQGLKLDVPVGTHDYLSFFYAVRSFNLTPSRRSVVSMLVENKPKTITVTSQKRETIQLGERAVRAIALTITTDDPEPDKYQLRMWISDDRRRLPLRISCATQLGPLRADLAILPTAPQ